MADLLDRLIARASDRVGAARPARSHPGAVRPAFDITDAMFASPDPGPDETPSPVMRSPDVANPPLTPDASVLPPTAPTPRAGSADRAPAQVPAPPPLPADADAHLALERDAVRPESRPVALTTVPAEGHRAVMAEGTVPPPAAAQPAARAAPVVSKGSAAPPSAPSPTLVPVPGPVPMPANGASAPRPIRGLPDPTTDVIALTVDSPSPYPAQPASHVQVARPTAPRSTADASPRAAEPPNPVIRISIGRIDVRATAPAATPAPMPAPTSSQPRVTLDAFLTRTSTGGRR